jgi:PAS domain S-box-containing protein
MARFAKPEEEIPFVNFLRERFTGRKPELVISVGSPAFKFLERNYEYLFGKTPLLISGVADRIVNRGKIPENAAVVPLRIDLRGMIEDILKVLPETKNIAVIFGSSAIERFWREECRREFAGFAERVDFTYLDGLPFEEIRRRIATLPPNSAIFFGLLILDASNALFDPGEAIKTVIAEANSPVFAVMQNFFGLGIVGGRLVQEQAGGLRAAEVALRLLQGESPANLSTPPLLSAVPVFDWRALQRWGIPETRLPDGSIVDFRQPSMWDRFHWHIIGGAGVVIVQSLLIFRFLVQIRRRQVAERELVKSEQNLLMITNALPVLIAYVDSDQRYRFANMAYRTWFGVNPEEALGRTIREVAGEQFYAAVVPYVERVLSGETVRYSSDIELDIDRSVSVEAIYVPDVDERGIVRGFYVLVMDVTERNLAQLESKRLQDELLQAGRISTMGELAGAIAHEINQPLSAIMSNAQAARRYMNASAPDLDEVKEILDDIAKESARAGEIISRLRGLLKKAKTTEKPLDLNLIFREVAGLLHSDAVIRGVQVSFELDPRLPLVQGDRIQLQQVALNLVLNAFDAVAEKPREERRVLLRTSRKDSKVLASVKDNGKGIPAGEAEKIFNPYYSSKPEGLGMGLSISRSIVSRHHGHIWAENNAEGGATLYFGLPVSTDDRGERRV